MGDEPVAAGEAEPSDVPPADAPVDPPADAAPAEVVEEQVDGGGSVADKLKRAANKAKAAGGLMEAAPNMEAAPEEPAAEEDEGGQALVGELLCKETGAVAKALFVPDGLRLKPAQLQGLMGTTWKLPPPNIMISCDAGNVHPNAFGSELLVKLKSFTQFWSDAQLHASISEIDKAQQDEFCLGIINDVIYLKLTTIFASVLDASSIAGNWIVVDRTSAKSPAAELLIEAAMAQTPSRPTVLCLDSMDRLKVFTGVQGDGPLAASTVACLASLEQVKGGAVPLGTDAVPSQEAINQFYSVDDFVEHSNYHQLPLPRPPEATHLLPDGTVSVPDRVKWQYHYLATFPGVALFGGGHYIVLTTAHDAPDLSLLGPFGYIVANGQAMMYDRLKNRINNGDPLVMLHNTGGVTQAFASLRKAMLSKVPPPEPNDLIDAIELVSPQAWTRQFGLPEILMMKELNQRAPMLLRNTVVAVDIMRDGSEDVLNTVTCCFSGGGGVPELGLGEAEMLCILTAWKRHLTLLDNAKKFERQADVIQLTLYLLSVLTTLLAVVYSLQAAAKERDEALAAAESGARMLSEAASGEEAPPADTSSPIGLIMVLLPILSTLLGTVRSKTRPREKWATCLMAGYQIVDQIYKYRLRVDRYDPTPPPSSGDDEEDEQISPKMRMAMARLDFVTTCAEIYKNAISSEVSKGGALKVGKVQTLQTQHEDQRREFMEALTRHVDENIYHKKIPKEKSKDSSSSMIDAAIDVAVEAAEAVAEAVEDAVENLTAEKKQEDEDDGAIAYFDDLVSQLDIETYIDRRVRPYVAYLEKRAPVMSRRGNLCEAAGLLANTTGAIFAVLALSSWISATVAVASVSGQLADYFYMGMQLGETNRALADCHALLNWWDSLSLVQRKTRRVKRKCALVVEGAFLTLCSARTAVSSKLPSEGGDGDAEEG